MPRVGRIGIRETAEPALVGTTDCQPHRRPRQLELDRRVAGRRTAYFSALDRGDHTDTNPNLLPYGAGMSHLSASFSAAVQVRIEDRPGSFARLAAAVGEAGASLGAIDLVSAERATKVRDVTVLATDATHLARVVEAMRRVDGTEVLSVQDRTFQLHDGGKIEVVAKTPLKTRDDLSMVYTPGVARVSQAIAADPQKAWTLTTKKNMVAIVTDGSAVLGLGDIGPEAALPVMEGKAMLFKDFGGVDAFPLCLATKDMETIVATVRASRRASAASTSRTSQRRGASRSRNACATSSTFPSFTTTSTAPRSPSSPRWSMLSASSGRSSKTSGS